MRTVKEVSEVAGISVRTLHYYDEIGLLRPTKITEAGYRLYDDKAMEDLQQILYFREFDMPLKDIKAIMKAPELDKNELLKTQQRILVLKKERLERIIHSIDSILKGDNRMDFEVFDKTEIEQIYNATIGVMSESQKDIVVREYGSIEQFEKKFKDNFSSEKIQKNLAKMIEWYGDKDSAMEAAVNPAGDAVIKAYQKRFSAIIKKLADKRGTDVNSFEVKEIVGELDFVAKQLFQMKDMTAFMLDMADGYMHDREMKEKIDKVYGEGYTEYIGQALEAFYKK